MVSSLIVTIILISVLVIAHEFGHFIVAKKSGIQYPCTAFWWILPYGR